MSYACFSTHEEQKVHMYTNKPFPQLTFHQQSEEKQVLCHIRSKSDEVIKSCSVEKVREWKRQLRVLRCYQRDRKIWTSPPPCLIALSILDQGTVIKEYGLLIWLIVYEREVTLHSDRIFIILCFLFFCLLTKCYSVSNCNCIQRLAFSPFAQYE